MVEWIIVNRYKVVDLLQYLDDFITAGPANSDQCMNNLQISLLVCRSHGLPLHPGKCGRCGSDIRCGMMMMSPDVEVTSDAAGSLRFGVYFMKEWFSGARAPCQSQQTIACKELFPVEMASHVWGPQWYRRHVLFPSDNEAVVHIMTLRTSTIPCIMQLLRHLLSSAAGYNFTFTAWHLPGIHNLIADALSCFCWQEFRHLALEVQLHPVPVPQ